jgi:hypothetical protein
MFDWFLDNAGKPHSVKISFVFGSVIGGARLGTAGRWGPGRWGLTEFLVNYFHSARSIAVENANDAGEIVCNKKRKRRALNDMHFRTPSP